MEWMSLPGRPGDSTPGDRGDSRAGGWQTRGPGLQSSSSWGVPGKPARRRLGRVRSWLSVSS